MTAQSSSGEPGKADPKANDESGGRSGIRQRLQGRGARWALWALGGLVVLSAVWLVVTALIVRSQLNDIKSELSGARAKLSQGDIAGARKLATDIADHASTAHLLSSGPVWAGAAAIPWLGEPLDAVRGVASAADDVGSGVIPPLVELSQNLRPESLRSSDGTFAVSRLTSAQPLARQAVGRTDRALADIRGVSHDTWLGAVNTAVGSVDRSLSGLANTLDAIDRAVQIAPTMLGEHGTQRYFVGFMNEAESRGLGGIPGSFAILEATNGRVKFVHFGSDSEFDGLKTDLNFGTDYANLYRSQNPTGKYIWSNTSPNFPYAAQIWAAMWQKRSGQQINGALALDPTALSYLLAKTGPAVATDGTKITSNNVVDLTQRTLYAKFPKSSDQAARKEYLTNISRVVDEKVLSSTNFSGLLDALGRAAGERRLLLWSRSAPVQRVLTQSEIGGVIPDDRRPYAGLFVISVGANKLDYYLDRSVKIVSKTCSGTIRRTVTVTLTNNAPRSGLSPYVTVRNDHPSYPVQPGDQKVDLAYFATSGAQLSSATLDGKAVAPLRGAERMHPVFSVPVELPAGGSRTVVFTVTEPASSEPLRVDKQPLVRDARYDVSSTGAC